LPAASERALALVPPPEEDADQSFAAGGVEGDPTCDAGGADDEAGGDADAQGGDIGDSVVGDGSADDGVSDDSDAAD
jgi:hypothetical protein